MNQSGASPEPNLSSNRSITGAGAEEEYHEDSALTSSGNSRSEKREVQKKVKYSGEEKFVVVKSSWTATEDRDHVIFTTMR